MKEIWRDIKGYKGFYQVSNYGRIKSLDRLIRHRIGVFSNLKERILKPLFVGRTREQKKVELHKNSLGKMFLISRLVATAFIPNPLNKPQVNHIDNNPGNNKVENLEWVTAVENMQHSVRQERNAYGERNGLSKLKEKDIVSIRKLYKNFSRIFNTYTLAKIYEVDQSSISLIVNKKIWKHI